MGGTDIHVDLAKREIDPLAFELLEKAIFITLFTEEAKEILIQLNSKWEEKIKVIPQGVMVPTFEVEQRAQTCPNKPFTILLPAGLRAVKDVLYLLPAWIELKKTIPHLQVQIIGEALDQSIYEKLIEVTAKYPFIQYLPPVPYNQIGEVYKQADIVINSSIQEGQSTSIAEAMALGIPVVVRDNAGNRSLVQHGSTGLLFQSPEEFTACIKRLITDTDLYERLASQAKKFILTEGSVQQEVSQYVKLLKKMRN